MILAIWAETVAYPLITLSFNPLPPQHSYGTPPNGDVMNWISQRKIHPSYLPDARNPLSGEEGKEAGTIPSTIHVRVWQRARSMRPRPSPVRSVRPSMRRVREVDRRWLCVRNGGFTFVRRSDFGVRTDGAFFAFWKSMKKKRRPRCFGNIVIFFGSKTPWVGDYWWQQDVANVIINSIYFLGNVCLIDN